VASEATAGPGGGPQALHQPAGKQAIPYGVYDLTSDGGWVNVGVDHDTCPFAVASIRRWWQARGRLDYPRATRLLITADAGGSNSYRYRAWKADPAAETGLRITVCHFPLGTSKWNKIEHRLFAHITMNWRRRPRPATRSSSTPSRPPAPEPGCAWRQHWTPATTRWGCRSARRAWTPCRSSPTPGMAPGTTPSTPRRCPSAPPTPGRHHPPRPGNGPRTPVRPGTDRHEPPAAGRTGHPPGPSPGRPGPTTLLPAARRTLPQRPGAGGRPLLGDADRVLITVVYLRQVCSQQVLSELLEVNPTSIGQAIAATRQLLEDHRCPAASRGAV
jgi:hypothetical protein